VRGLSADYEEIQKITKLIHGYLDKAGVAHVTAPSGTDLVIDIRNSAVVSDGNLQSKGRCTNLPTGETELAPRNAKGSSSSTGAASTSPNRRASSSRTVYIVSYEGTRRQAFQAARGGGDEKGRQQQRLVHRRVRHRHEQERQGGRQRSRERKVFGTCHVGSETT